MIRKLAVTVFALSFAALGCGSDSGTPTNKDSGPPDGGSRDATLGAEVQLGPVDVAPQPDGGVVEAGVGVDVVAPTDLSPVDGLTGVDTQKLDAQKLDTTTPPTDTTTVSPETTPAQPDAPSLDDVAPTNTPDADTTDVSTVD